MSSIFYLICFLLSQIIISEDCSDIKDVKDINLCSSYSNESYYCCYDNENTKCEPVEKKAFDRGDYKLDCGIIDDNYEKYEFHQYHPKQNLDIGFQTCGRTDPQKKSHCTDYSDISNSCCLFTDTSTQTKGCFSIGRRVNKDSKKGKFSMNDKTYEFECFSIIIRFNIYILILTILFLC